MTGTAGSAHRMPSVREPVNGILLLDKPTGLSSHAALSRAKRALNAQKAGHTGTLDPLASGLLPLCFGEATKFASDLLEADKSYRATLQLGQTTATGDAEGEVLERRAVDASAAQVEAVLARFRGPIRQIPPMYSALKRDGRPLYDYARAGVTLEREARGVTIHALRLLGREGDVLSLEVDCSKGTYIRTLAEDIGRELGCGAHLAGLVRTRVGHLELAAALPLEALEALDGGARRLRLLPIDELIQSLPKVCLDDQASGRFQKGQSQTIAGAPDASERVGVYAHRAQPERFLGLGALREEGLLVPVRLLASRPEKG